jgi:tRNA uridine 5-carboxymethylaminomethyl modification enzyme
MGAKTLIFVIKIETIGRMSCNPSVGGPAKGHLARELDAIGGEIGRAADISGIQFRMLNKKKGPAVWAPRSQNDRIYYGIIMQHTLEGQSSLEIKEATIDDILLSKDGKSVIGVRSKLGESYYAPRIILANGTFPCWQCKLQFRQSRRAGIGKAFRITFEGRFETGKI